MRTFTLALFMLCGADGLSQNLTETFGYPAGTNIPNWIEQRGDWTSNGASIRPANTATFQEATLSAILDSTAAAEVLVTYDLSVPNLQYGGPVLRHSGAGAGSTFFMVKIQDNATPYTGFDFYFAYYFNGSTFTSIGLAGALPVPTTSARVRLQVTDLPSGSVQVQVFIDTDLDGNWNVTGSTSTLLGAGQSGLVGVCGFRSVYLDNFKYYSGTMISSGQATPGSSSSYTGYASPNVPYIVALSLGHTGFPLPAGGICPIDFDQLFQYTFLDPLTFSSVLGTSSSTGTYVATVNWPAIATLTGVRLWIASVTHNGISEIDITPDLEVLIL